jgi:phosphoribosylamine--glycine ligase
METVMRPTVRAMASEGILYKGVLYAGLMVAEGRINVLEFNARFGDPETQPLMMRMKSDIVSVMEAVCNGTLHECSLDIDERAAVCVVMTAGGYPGRYDKGSSISGLGSVSRMKDVMAFHAGTRVKGKQVVTDGGRVLGVTALGNTVEQAITRAYEAVSRISWKDSYHRTDIGGRALKREGVRPLVSIVMGSDSDLPVMEEVAGVLKRFDVAYEFRIASAHRTPEKAAILAESARRRGIRVIIAGAGMAAALPGSLAAHTTLPVIGVPINASPMNGLDALLSMAQMPPGVPVATVAVGKPGAKNAGLLAVQILAVTDENLAEKLSDYKKEMADEVERKEKALNEKRT